MTTIDGAVGESGETESKTTRSFSDVQVNEENFMDYLVQTGRNVTHYYRHKRTRSFHIGEFSFEDFILTIRSEGENQRWIDTYMDLPLEERTQIVEYHPELVAQIERPVGSNVVRGAVASSLIPDQKVISGNGSGFSFLKK